MNDDSTENQNKVEDISGELEKKMKVILLNYGKKMKIQELEREVKEKEMKEENLVSFVTWEKKVLLWNRSVPTGNKFL